MARSEEEIRREIQAEMQKQEAAERTAETLRKEIRAEMAKPATDDALGLQEYIIRSTGGEVNDDQASTLGRLVRRTVNALEYPGGTFMWLMSRPQQKLIYEPLMKQHPEAFARLLETLPEGEAAPLDVPSALAHAQLDAAEEATREKGGAFDKLDAEPMINEMMDADLRAEHFTVVEHFGGDWNAYAQWRQDAKWGERAALKFRHLVTDITLDPMNIIGEFAPKVVGKVAQGISKAAKLDDHSKVMRKGVSEVVAYQQKLTDKYNTMVQEGASTAELTRVQKRIMEAGRVIAGRAEEARLPQHRMHELMEIQSNIVQPTAMTDAEVARRQVVAAERADTDEVAEAIDTVFGSVDNLQSQLQEISNRIAAGTSTDADRTVLRQLDQMPDNIKSHLDELGISAERARRAGALRSSMEDLAQHTDLNDPAVASQLDLLGPSDGQEAGDGIRALMNGADPEDIPIHGLETPEYRNLGKGETAITPDGLWIREMPASARRIEDVDQFSTLSGRAMPGYTAGSRVLNVGRLALNLLDGVRGAILPTQPVSFIPEVARMYNAAENNYKLMYNESKVLFRDLLAQHHVIRVGKKGMMELTDEGATILRQALSEDVLPPGPAKNLQEYLLTWMDAKNQAIGGAEGATLRVLLQTLKPASKMNRALEFVGLSPEASLSVINDGILPHDGNSLLNLLDFVNRAVHRKGILEPTYALMNQHADDLAKAGKTARAAFARKFTDTVMGRPKSLFSHLGDMAQVPPRLQEQVSRFTMATTALMHKALLNGSTNYVMQNLSSGVLNNAMRDGAFSAIEGLLYMSNPKVRAGAKAAGATAEAFQRSYEGGLKVPILDTLDKITDWGSKVEDLVRGASFVSGFSKAMQRTGKSFEEIDEVPGLMAAVQREAIEAVEFSQHVFGPRGRNPYWHSMLGRAGLSWTQHLLTYPYKQTELLARSAVENPGLLMRYMVYTGIATRLAARELGISLDGSLGVGYMPDYVRNMAAGRPPVAPAMYGESQVAGTLRQTGLLSPGNAFIAALFNYAAAGLMQDPKKLEAAKYRLDKAADALKPGVRQYRKQAQRYADWKAGKANVGKKYERPLGPKEKIPHLIGLQTPEDRKSFEEYREKLDKTRRKAVFKAERKKIVGRYREALKDYDKAIKVGDARGVHEAYMKLQEHGVTFSNEPDTARREALFLQERLRMLEHSPDFMHEDGKP